MDTVTLPKNSVQNDKRCVSIEILNSTLKATSYLVDPNIVIKVYNISTFHKNMHVLKYSILNSFAQNPAISTFFRKVHSDEREFAG